jgi:hypothetical protein
MASVCCEGEDVGSSAEAAVAETRNGENLAQAKKALGNKGLRKAENNFEL